jgi:hypothetical protein
MNSFASILARGRIRSTVRPEEEAPYQRFRESVQNTLRSPETPAFDATPVWKEIVQAKTPTNLNNAGAPAIPSVPALWIEASEQDHRFGALICRKNAEELLKWSSALPRITAGIQKDGASTVVYNMHWTEVRGVGYFQAASFYWINPAGDVTSAYGRDARLEFRSLQEATQLTAWIVNSVIRLNSSAAGLTPLPSDEFRKTIRPGKGNRSVRRAANANQANRRPNR